MRYFNSWSDIPYTFIGPCCITQGSTFCSFVHPIGVPTWSNNTGGNLYVIEGVYYPKEEDFWNHPKVIAFKLKAIEETVG